LLGASKVISVANKKDIETLMRLIKERDDTITELKADALDFAKSWNALSERCLKAEADLKTKNEQIEIMSIPSEVIGEIQSCSLYGTGCHKPDCVFKDRCAVLSKKNAPKPTDKPSDDIESCSNCKHDGTCDTAFHPCSDYTPEAPEPPSQEKPEQVSNSGTQLPSLAQDSPHSSGPETTEAHDKPKNVDLRITRCRVPNCVHCGESDEGKKPSEKPKVTSGEK
jgi:hypothetical protein